MTGIMYSYIFFKLTENYPFQERGKGVPGVKGGKGRWAGGRTGKK